MTVRQQWLAVALGGAIGLAILLLTDASGLGGSIIGAAACAAWCILILDRRTARLDADAEDLTKTRAQYEAAHATLMSQRERMRSAFIRMRVEFEGSLAEHTAALNAKHQSELFEAARTWYEQGAIDAITGRFNSCEQSDVASVIRLANHRRPHS